MKNCKHIIFLLILIVQVIWGNQVLWAQNTPPFISNGIPNQHAVAGKSFSYTIPSNAFKDLETKSLRYSATGLPSGITFESNTRIVKGTPSSTGKFDITITAADALGLSASETFSLTIHRSSDTYAAFTANTNKGCNFQEVKFTNKSNNGTSWNWDFGNGNTSNIKDPSAIFTQPGTYTVTLKINNGATGDLVCSEQIYIYPSPDPEISVGQEEGCAPFDAEIYSTGTPVQIAPYTYEGSSIGGISGAEENTYQWSFYGKLDPQITTTPILLLNGIEENIDIIQLKITDKQGCEGNTYLRDPFDIFPRPSVTFTVDKERECEPSTTTFTALATSTEQISQFIWKLNGSILSERSNTLTHQFTAFGEYVVSVQALAKNGCNSLVYTDTIRFNDNNTADFNYISECVGDSSEFTLIANNVSHCSWDFGDGQTSIQRDPKHIYASSGNYNVSVVVTFTDGCTKQVSKTVRVDGITIDFSTTKLVSCAQPRYQFTDISTVSPDGNYITERKWYLRNQLTGDYELKSTAASCTLDFATIGIYRMKLEIESVSGCQASIIKEFEVTEPTFTFETPSSLRGCVPHTIDFVARFSDEVQTAANYDWDFDGDGTIDETTTSPNNSHIYTAEGSYIPEVTVRTAEGCTFTNTLNVNISPSAQPSIYSITYTQTPEKCRTDTVKFTITYSLGVDTIRIETHGLYWIYTIDPLSTTSTIPFIFPEVGDNITLNFQAFKNGCASNIVSNNDISINKPVAIFRPIQSTFCTEPYEAKFTNSCEITNPANVQYEWSFGNGMTSTEANPGTISYSSPGNYNVKLKVTDLETGCSDETLLPLFIYKFDKSEDLIWSDNTTGCHPTEITFGENISSKISSNLSINAYKWDFDGDGTVDDSTSRTPTFTYDNPGLYDLSLTVYAQNGCEYNITRNDYIDIKGPVAQFNINKTITCEGVVLDLDNTSHKAPSDPDGISAYYWTTDVGEFIHGTNASSHSPELMLTKSDSIHITLLVENSGGCIDQITKADSIYVEEWDANFITAQDTFCLGQTVDFTNRSIGNVTSKWDFGDGSSIATTKNASHLYEQTGNYSVTLTSTNSMGCGRSISKTIVVVEGTADFYVPEPGCAPAFTYFVPKVDDQLVQSYLWDFGSGETSTERMPGHMYQKPGYYTVSLEVTLRSGCTYSETKVDSVFVDGPDGNFIYDATLSCSNTSVQFIASGLYNLSGLTWDFGDGITTDVEATGISSDTIDHIYTSSGSRTPSLILHAAGATCSSLALFNSALGQIKISDSPRAEFISSAEDGICENIEITFTDRSSQIDPTYAINQWLWDFGDGTSSTEQNPTHTFSQSGDYIISLTVINEVGCSDTISKTFSIAELDDLSANFTYDPIRTCPGTPITFTSTSTTKNGSIKTYDWNFGDGSASQQIKPKHTYSNGGSTSKTVTLTITDSKQCSASINKEVSINSLDVDFVYSPSTIYRSNEIRFYGQIDNKGDSEITSTVWTFESGMPSSALGETPETILFDTIATGKKVTLTVTNSDGCETIVEKTIDILNNPPTVADIVLDDIFENSSATFDDEIFKIKFDANDILQELEKIRFSALPSDGKLLLNGIEITLITEVPVEQIDNITFVPNTNWSGTITFNWDGFDGFNWANEPATVTIEVKDITGAISILSWTYRVQKNETLIIPTSDLKAHFGNGAQNDQLQQIHISELPQNGTLKSNGNNITTSNNVFTLAQLVANPLTFIPNKEFTGTTTIKWRGSDGTNYAPDQGTISIIFYNNIPEIQNIEYNIAKDSILTIQRSKFEEKFIDQTPSDNTFHKIQITHLPDDSGILSLNGREVNEFDEFTYSELSQGLIFTPNKNYQGKTQFQWNAYDGSDYAEESAWVIINYANTAPSMEDLHFEIEEDESLLFTSEDFKAKFKDKDRYDSLNSIIIRTMQMSRGQIFLDEEPVSISDRISVDDLDRMKFVPTPNYFGETSFEISVSDGTDIAFFNSDIFITVKSVNDTPIAVADSFFINEDQFLTNVSLADNDSDVDHTPSELSYQLITDVATIQNEWGIPKLEQNGDFSFTPKANYFNESGIVLTYRVCDPENACDTAEVFIAIHPTNDAPIATKDEISVFMGITQNISLLDNDYDIDGTLDASTLKILIQPKKGSATANDDSTITYTGTSLGRDTLRYEIRDNEHLAGYAWVYITIVDPAERMAAVNDHYSTWEDSPIQFEPAENDIHIRPELLQPSSIDIVTRPRNGNYEEVLENGQFNGRLQYNPKNNYFGLDSLKYEISDSLGNKAQAWIFIDIEQVNDAPMAEDFDETTLEDVSIDINLANHASDADGDLDPTTAVIFDRPKHGTATENGNGTITYVPNLNYNGNDTLTYLIYDQTGLVSNIATVFISITSDDDPPIAIDDWYTTEEDTSILADVLTNDSDPDGNIDRSKLKVIDQPQNGIASVQGEMIQYKPNDDFFGTDQFSYAIFDKTNLSDTAVVTIEVTARPDDPRPQPDSIRIDEDTNCVYGPSTDYDKLLDNDIEVDGESILVTSILYNGIPATSDTIYSQYGRLTWTADGSFSFCINTTEADTLRQGDIITEEFTYIVTDVTNRSAESALIISIYGKNDPPIAVSDRYEVDEGSLISKGIEEDSLFLSNDYDFDSDHSQLRVIDVNGSSSSTIIGTYGTLTWFANGTFKYEPIVEKTRSLRPGDSATDLFSYKISDEYGATAESDITFTIWGENNSPECTSDTIEVVFKGLNDINVLINDKDYDSGSSLFVSELRTDKDTLRTEGAVVGIYGELFWKASGEVVYTPAEELTKPLMPDELVIDEYYYTVSDGEKTCNTTIFVYIIGENDPITAHNDSVTIDEDEYIQAIEVLSNDEDPDNYGKGNFDYGSLQIIAQPNHGKSYVNTATGTISFFPDKNYYGTDSLKYRICDMGQLCDEAWVFITINPANDAPEATHLIIKTTVGVPVSFDGSQQITDIDGNLDISTLSFFSQPDNGKSENIDAVITYTPDDEFTGQDEFIYSIADQMGESAFVIVTTIVVPDSSSFFAQDDYTSTKENEATAIYILANDTIGGVFPNPLSANIIVHPKHGIAVYDIIEHCVHYTPIENFSGIDTLQYIVSGDNGQYDMASVFIEVKFFNDQIVARDDFYKTTIGTYSISLPILDNDSDPDSEPDSWKVEIVSTPKDSEGKIILDKTSNNVIFYPTNGYSGTVTFTYRICDSNVPSTCDMATVYILVKPIPNHVFAVNDYYTTNLNESFTLDPHPMDNDSLGLIDAPEFLLFDDAQHGTAIESNGTITYTPDPNYFGPDWIHYRICQNTSCDFGEINIWVNEVNIPPVAQDDSLMVSENEEKRLLILSNDFDIDGYLDYQTLELETKPNSGEVTIDKNTGSILYKPQANAAIDKFSYKICDNKSDCSTATVIINVDLGSTILTKQVLYEDCSDTLDVQPLMEKFNLFFDINRTTSIKDPSNGEWKNINSSKIVYTPTSDYNGSDFYSLELCDASGTTCANLQVNVTILPVNDAPIANEDSIIWNSINKEFTFIYDTLLINDIDIDSDSIFIVPEILNHVPELNLSYNSDGTLTLTADTIYWCEAWFEYKVGDPQGATEIGIVNLLPILTGIEAVNDSASVDEDNEIDIDVLANDKYTDGQRCTIDTIFLIDGPFNGIASITDLLDIHYTPTTSYWGQDSIKYSLVDQWGQCDSAWVFINVEQENLPPIAVDDEEDTQFGVPQYIDILENDYDQDEDGYIDTLRTYISLPPTLGTAYFDSLTGNIVYTSSLESCEDDRFEYTIFDNEGDSATASVTIIMGTEAPLFTVPDTIMTYPGLAVQVFPLVNDSGYFEPYIYQYTNPGYGYIVLNGTDAFTYTPDGGFIGRDSIMYQIQSLCGNTTSEKILFLVEKLRVPEIISPNDDGKNDFLIIDGIEYFPDCLFQVYNRLGHIVYEQHGYLNQWNGFSNRGSLFKDETLPSGTYYYTLTYNNGNNKQQGIIYIFR